MKSFSLLDRDLAEFPYRLALVSVEQFLFEQRKAD
jgi:hypothetical protein